MAVGGAPGGEVFGGEAGMIVAAGAEPAGVGKFGWDEVEDGTFEFGAVGEVVVEDEGAG